MTLPHDSLGGIMPFEVVHSYAPHTNWDWKLDLPDTSTSADQLNTKAAVAYALRHRKAWDFVCLHL